MSATEPRTFTYKTVNGLTIEADVYMPANEKAVESYLCWFHGGGLLMSNRQNIAPHLKRAATTHNIAFISFDYRLAPQASLLEICEDVKAAIAWARNDLMKVYPHKRSSTKLSVGGASAGGYLSLLSGLKICGVEPAPDCIVALYPITDPLGPFFTTKQSPVSYNEGRIITHEDMAAHIDPKAPALPQTSAGLNPTSNNRVNLYTYMIQEANLAELLFVNAPPGTKVEDYVIHRNINDSWVTPTWILHGDIDDKVGIEQARSVVKAFKAAGKELNYIEIKGAAQHGYDYDTKEEVAEMYKFIKSSL